MFKKPKIEKRPCFAVSICMGMIFIAALVCFFVAVWKKFILHDSKHGHSQKMPQIFAQAPGPQAFTISGNGHGWASSPPAPAVEARPPVPSPLPTSFSVIGPAPSSHSSYSPSLYLEPYEVICNKTVDRAVCLNLFRSYPNSHKVMNLQQSTLTAMEAADHALNESYVLAQGMKKRTEGNVNTALQQCIEVFADALENVNTSLSLVAAMDENNLGGSAGADVQSFMSAAMTNHDTCQEGIDDVGPFPGCEQIIGTQAKHVDTMLSIALTFVTHLSGSDGDHHRRLLHSETTNSGTPSLPY